MKNHISDMTRRTLIRGTSAVMVAAVSLAMGSTGVLAETPQTGGSLAMLVKPEPNTLASYRSTAGPVGQVADKIYDGLLEYDFDLKPKPSLAESWDTSEDGLTITFHLRQGVTFHDGSTFDSADVKYSIEEVLKKIHPRASQTFKDVESIETPDGHTVIMRLSQAAPYLMTALSGHETPMLNKETFEGSDPNENPTANAPNGTGPFKFTEWKKGQYIRLDRNDNYWRDGQPYLDRIVVRFITDAGTRAAAIEKGEVDFAAFNAVPYVDAARLEALDGITITTSGYEMINPLMLFEVNTQIEPMNNQSVRQAISYAIDRQQIIDSVFFGYGKPATGMLSSNFSTTGLYTSDVRDYSVADRVERAKALLDEAGFAPDADGVRFGITFDILPYGDQWQRLGEYLKQALGDVGIDVTLRIEDPAKFFKRIYTDYDYQMDSTFFYQFADPVIGVHRQYLTSQIRKGVLFVNGARFSDAEVDNLLEQASNENDDTARAAIYHKVQKKVAELLPVIPIFEMEFITVHKDSVQNAVTSPLGVYTSFNDVWLKK